MLSLRHKSKSTRTPFIVLGFCAALLVTMAVRPVASLAEPAEPPQLAFEPDHYDFGLQPLSWGPAQTTFQLRNTGAEAFQVGSPQISGPGAGAFWTGNSNCYGSFLQPGEACYAQVYFGPNDTTEFSAQFSVNVGSYSFSAGLSGVGGRAAFVPASNPSDFGTAAVGSAGVTRTIQVSNAGNMPGGVFIAVISGGAIGSFDLLDESCTGIQLAPAATCALQVRFQPLSEGVKKATLSLFGDGDAGTQILLMGIGSAPEPASAASRQSPDGASAAVPALVQRSGHRPGRRRAKVQRRARRHRVALSASRVLTRSG